MGKDVRNTFGRNEKSLAVQLPSLLCQVGNSLSFLAVHALFDSFGFTSGHHMSAFFVALCTVVRFVPAFVPSFRHEISAAPPRGGL